MRSELINRFFAWKNARLPVYNSPSRTLALSVQHDIASPQPKEVSLTSIISTMPPKPLFGDTTPEHAYSIGFPISPTPYAITQSEHQFLRNLGPALHQFVKAVNLLYRQSLKKSELKWVQDLYHHGKPEELIRLARANQIKHDIPIVMRPDLIPTEEGFKIAEIEAEPAGIGFAGALKSTYETLGFDNIVGTKKGIPEVLLDALLAKAPKDKTNPSIAFVLSNEYAPYKSEIAWTISNIQETYPNIAMINPEQLSSKNGSFGFIDATGEFKPIDIIYRCFELFEMFDLPNHELIIDAIKQGQVTCFPTLKPYLEEKLSLALLHNPILESFWLAQLGEDNLRLLQSATPKTWILDPSPVPSHATVTPPLVINGIQHHDFTKLSELPRSQRNFIIKNSGYSRDAMCSRSIKVGHSMNQDDWKTLVEHALQNFKQGPSVMQEFHKPVSKLYSYYDPSSGELIQSRGRTRFSPFYFIVHNQSQLAGVLVTTRPQNNEIIHGWKDGTMQPAMVVEN